MARPWVLVCLLLLIVFSSQFEWNQQYEDELQLNSNIPQKQQHISEREEPVKEKIILAQERNIQKLNKLVRDLQLQLQQCRSEHEVVSESGTPLTELVTELERQPSLED